jgi:hypothetical protein
MNFFILVLCLCLASVSSAGEPLRDSVTGDFWLICDLVPMYKMQHDNKLPTGGQLLAFLKEMDDGKDPRITESILRISLGRVVINSEKPAGKDFVMKYCALGSKTWRVLYADRSMGDELVAEAVPPSPPLPK